MARTNKFVNISGRDYRIHKSIFCINESPVIVSDRMTGKMSGVPSISTSCITNPICRKRVKDKNSVCAHCFAMATLARHSDAGENCENNYRLLNDSVLPLDQLPIFGNVRFVRIESFGDVASVKQAVNYLNIFRVNPLVTFGAWSKNIGIWDASIKFSGGKPKNLILVESSPVLGVSVNPHSVNVDHVFTVFEDEESADRNGVKINCGERSCAGCGRCYTKRTGLKINEILK